jgi:heme oxygenase
MTDREDTTSSLPLADFLKSKTWSLHVEAEKTGVVADIIRQQIIMRDYLNFVYNLERVYRTLESEMVWLGRFEPLQEFFTSKLFRHGRLRRDYENLLSRQTLVALGPLYPVTVEYCSHISRAQNFKPTAMLAHIYVRYLGDLNGGQVLRRLLKSSLRLSDDCLSFYDFPSINNIHQFTSEFRNALDAIVLTESERDEVHRAAMDAFRFNITLSQMCQS